MSELQEAMNRKEITSAELTTCYLDRIAELNGDLHAVIEAYPAAKEEAKASDARRSDGQAPRSSLEGIPVLFKDNIETGGAGHHTTAGSEALVDSPVVADAFLVSQLRSKGAIVLGKANLSEWAGFRSFPSSSGWSARGGQTNNPHVLDRNPCGSSSGSAVAVAADLAAVAIGTETDGSIVCPAGMNGVVGVKPTLGLVSRNGVVPISSAQDTPGVLARSVADAAVVLSAMQGVDPIDPATSAAADHLSQDYTAALEENSLEGKRIGLWQASADRDRDVSKVVDAAKKVLTDAGATMVEVEFPDSAFGFMEASERALTMEFKRDINQYLASRDGSHPRNLAELIQFNKDHASSELVMGGGNQVIFESAEATSADEASIAQARQSATSQAKALIDNAIDTHRLDAIAAPTNSPAWVTNLDKGDGGGLGSAGPPAVAGYPNITVPAGFGCDDKLPIGMSVFGGQWQEPSLLSIADAFEHHTQAYRVPKLHRTARCQ